VTVRLSENRVGQFATLSTTCFTTFDVLFLKYASAAYSALTEDVPTGNVEVVKLAEPLFNVPVPSIVVPSTKDTVSPLGGVPTLAVTVAVKVTGRPEVDGFGDEVIAAVVVVNVFPRSRGTLLVSVPLGVVTVT
jgi:hypothetical protein